MNSPYVVWFKDIDTHETSPIGKEGKRIGSLVQAGFPLLPGFIITHEAYFAFLKEDKLEHRIKNLLTTVNYDHPVSIHQVMEHIKKMVAETPFPESFLDELEAFHDAIDGFPITVHGYSKSPLAHKIASQTATNFDELLDAIHSIWVDHFEPNMHWKRHEHGHDHLTTGIEIIVQIDAQPEKKGRIHTVDPHNHAKHVLLITHDHPHASDTYILSKKNLTILDRKLTHHNSAAKLDQEELLTIAEVGKQLEQHLYFPQEIAWGIIGETVYILHTKPLSTLPKEKTHLKKKPAHARGVSITSTIGSGVVRIIADEKDLSKVTVHDIVIVKHIDKPQLQQAKKARGIINETGDKHSEISVLIRQLGIPTLFTVKDATKRFKNGHIITIHGGKGEVYLGSL